MLGIERRQRIMEILHEERKVYVPELSRNLGVTQETIRRDLEKLEVDGLLRRSYGGAVLARPANEDLSIANRTATNYQEKMVIARKAAALIEDDMSIMAESSSTVLALIGMLRERKNLTIVTNSVKLLGDHAGSGFTMFSTGGELRGHSLSLVGTTACRSLESFNVDVAAFSCKGLDREKGVTESNEPEAAVKLTMARQAKKRILLADHTKFDQSFLVKTLTWSDVDCVVTDAEPAKPWFDFFRRNGIQLSFPRYRRYPSRSRSPRSPRWWRPRRSSRRSWSLPPQPVSITEETATSNARRMILILDIF